MPRTDIPYEQLPQRVKDNLSADQWAEAEREVVMPGDLIPETTQYVNLKNGLLMTCEAGQAAPGPMLPTHDLSGAGGRDDAQFHTAPPGAHNLP
jgi:hypothetical protein